MIVVIGLPIQRYEKAGNAQYRIVYGPVKPNDPETGRNNPKDIKNISELTHWCRMKCDNEVKIVEKKSVKYLEITGNSPYLCTRFERETPLESDKNWF